MPFLTALLPFVFNLITCGSYKKAGAHLGKFVDRSCSSKKEAAQSLRSVIYSIVIITSIIWVLIFIIITKEDAWNRVMSLIFYFTDQQNAAHPLCK